MTAQGSQKRITKVCTPCQRLDPVLIQSVQELGDLLTSPPTGIAVSLADESDIYKWKVVMDGPKDSPYAVSWNFPKFRYLSHRCLS
jgi:thiol-disulfide isomerase/thioredoxin